MSAKRHLAPGVDTTLSKAHFAVVTDAFGAVRFPVNSNKFPPTVNIVRSFSSFSGFTAHTIFSYIHFLYFGTWALGMKMTVFFSFTILIPWSNLPSSFANDISQIFLSGTFIRCLYSWPTLYIWWVTALASWVFLNCDVNAKSGMGVFCLLISSWNLSQVSRWGERLGSISLISTLWAAWLMFCRLV